MKTDKDFETVADAVAWGNQMEQERDSAVQAQQEAEEVANDAIAKADEALARADKAEAATEQALKDVPKSYIADLPDIGKVKVRFGVNGLTRDQVLADEDLLEHLVDIGSNAVEVLEQEGGAE